MFGKKSNQLRQHRAWHMTTMARVIALLLSFALVTRAQNTRIAQTITSKQHAAPSLGRNTWFTLLSNYNYQNGKCYNLYITSTKQTKVYVELAHQGPKV